MTKMKMTRMSLKKEEKMMNSLVGLSVRTGLLMGFAGLMFCGCDKGPTLSEIEAKERTSRYYKNAMDDLQAGHLEPAIKGFTSVLREEPGSYSAHFQLATLLQDVRKDYLSAISHYKAYLELRPASDKATVAQDRLKFCETMLQAQILRKAGGSASNKLAADNEKLTKERDDLTAQVKKLEGELAKAKRDVTRLEAENAAKSRNIQRLSEAVEGSSAARTPSIKKALAEIGKLDEENERRRLRPTDAELLDSDDDNVPDLRNSAELKGIKDDLAKLDAETQDPPAAGGTSTAKPAAGGKKQPTATVGAGAMDQLFGAKKGKNPTTLRPETYTVQDGDTLFKISHRFYGSARKWRAIQEANRAIVPADGRVRAGQVLKLP